jgi:hypothetical protein
LLCKYKLAKSAGKCASQKPMYVEVMVRKLLDVQTSFRPQQNAFAWDFSGAAVPTISPAEEQQQRENQLRREVAAARAASGRREQSEQ